MIRLDKSLTSLHGCVAGKTADGTMMLDVMLIDERHPLRCNGTGSSGALEL
jgi:hypothetical protein